MNKYKVIYYLSIVVFIVNLLAMIGSLFGWFTIGTDLGWFNMYQGEQSFWLYFALIPVVEWIEKKSKGLEVVKGEKL